MTLERTGLPTGVGMNYWWVNHSQTARQEISGGYIWSPTTNKDRTRNRTYENLRDVVAGDLVFSYADARIGAIGIAEDRFISGERPAAFGKSGEQWAREGWSVPISWTILSKSIRPQEHLSSIVPLLPTKYSPIRANGHGNQKFYLLAISDTLGRLLLAIAGQHDANVMGLVQDLEQSVSDDQEEGRVKKQNISVVEKEQLIKARRGQGAFRFNVERIEKRCRLTGVDDKRFLIASHIKPWRASSNEEKLDGNNGLLLSPHVDKLFDRGWIGFSNSGKVLCASNEIEQLIQLWGLDGSRNVGAFGKHQQRYLDYHRAHVLRRR